MIGAQLKVNHEYAVSTEPRKGVKDLHTITATRWRITAKGVRRYAMTGGKEQEGTSREDGIQAVPILPDGRVDLINLPDGRTFKARDFLMPWSDYQAEQDRRNAEAQAEVAKEIAEREEREERARTLSTRLQSEFGLQPVEDFRVWSSTFDFTYDGVEKLMNAVSAKVYEIVSSYN
jgi:cation transport regulator ChaB